MITIETLKQAFRKLLSHSYYDRMDLIMRRRVAEFARSLSSKEQEDAQFSKLLEVAQGRDSQTLDEWLWQISMLYYPKSLSNSVENKVEEDHLITNISSKNAVVNRLIIKADIPVELCILDAAWVLEYGYLVDRALPDNCWGNRLELSADKSSVKRGNAMFKPYYIQYNLWWAQGVEIANKHLKTKEPITIINFDITNCYHSIDFSFEVFFSSHDDFIRAGGQDDTLTKIVVKIYEHYWSLAHQCGEEAFRGQNQGKHPLPLSLMSAHVLANWYLEPLDRYITSAYPLLYYGRYVDDCMVVVPTRSVSDNWAESIEEELPGLLCFVDGVGTFGFAKEKSGEPDYARLAGLEIQKKKMYVYRFNCMLPPLSLEEYERELKKRSSEFRFLTDDADPGAVNLELTTLISVMDVDEEGGRRFNILEENKYKLAVYLAKLSDRLAKFGERYEHYDEVDKIFSYFIGGLLIKHYAFWERMMTVFVLARKKDYVEQFTERILEQIHQLNIKEGLFDNQVGDGLDVLKSTLVRHLMESRAMALSLHRESLDITRVYLETFMARMHYNAMPLQEFCKDYEKDGVFLPLKKLEYRKTLLRYRWIPYYVKYYDIVMMLSLGNTYDPDVFGKAYEIYNSLNHTRPYITAKAFWHHLDKDGAVSEFNPHLTIEEDGHGDFTVAVVNMDLDNKEGELQIKHFGIRETGKLLTMRQVLDKVSEAGDVELFILPEISLPVYELREYCYQAAKKERAFVAGVEYYVKKRTVYNYIITCLPITLFGRKDAVPIIRLKNHYAPVEYKTIKKLKMQVPQNDKVYQNLYHWRDHTFTTYYCYELTSIQDRSFFFSKIDAMYCPVFNPDTFYFNNIAESMVRDMHCYFVLSNVSHFGDSRVTAPMKHDRMNLLKVKGGNTSDNKAVVLTTTLDIDYLREFELMTTEEQEEEIKRQEAAGGKATLKCTPPDYNKKDVVTRRNFKFVYEYEDPKEDFFDGLDKMLLEY